jgi:DNA-binding CsgD family transcriptional regulator
MEHIRDREILGLYYAGRSLDDIADVFSLEVAVLRQILTLRGVNLSLTDDFEIYKKQIFELLDQNIPVLRISEITGVSMDLIRKNCNILGIDVSRDRYKRIKKLQYRKTYMLKLRGYTAKQIQERLGITEATVFNHIKQYKRLNNREE